MIKHVVLWKLAAEAQGATKDENALRMKAAIESLTQSIPFVRELEVGIDIEGSDAAWDVVLYSAFDSVEDLEAYQAHPEHLKVRDLVLSLTVKRAVVDYVTGD